MNQPHDSPDELSPPSAAIKPDDRLPAGCIGVLCALVAEAVLAAVCVAVIGLSKHGSGFSGAMSKFGFAMMVLTIGAVSSPIVMFLGFLWGRKKAKEAALEALQASHDA